MTGATAKDTQAFVEEALKRNTAREHFRNVEGLWCSSIGFGTYLGAADDETDELYRRAVVEAVERGCNFLDTAINYRHQRSERVIARALHELAERKVPRERMIVATKGGYIPFDSERPSDDAAYLRARFLDRGVMQPEDIVAGCHVLEPSFLRDQIDQSLANLGLDTLDIYYLHNPETQLGAVERSEFHRRLRAAFECLEEAVREKKIAFYGTATWSGYLTDPKSKEFLSLSAIVELAREVSGESHHFRFIQAPYNLGTPVAFTTRNQTVEGEAVSLCQAAERLGVHLVASASIAQGRLTEGLPDWLGTLFKGLDTDVQRSLQFVRSTPGVTAALVGMKSLEHVRENLGTARMPPAAMEDFLKLFEVDSTGE